MVENAVVDSVKVESSNVNSGAWKLRDNEVDTAHFFSTRDTWKDKDELLGWVRRQANRAGFTVIIRRSCEGRNAMLELVCERSGVHKAPKRKLKHEATGSRKCECLFKLRGYVVREDNAWKLAILNGVHNHEMVPYVAGHLLAGRLMEEDKKIVHDLTDSSVKPKNILTNLKNKRKESMTNIKQVYNERYKFKKAKRGDLTEMQYLILKLEENGYVYYVREKPESQTVQDIFWTHPTSVKLFNNFPTVLVMDSTYKTNLYRMALFEIVGVTSTYLTYSVGFAFLTSEKEDNFTWALQMLLKLHEPKSDMPKVVVTDRDTSMMNAVANVLPGSSAILCYFHVEKNVRARIITDCKVKQNVVVVDGQKKIVDEEKHSKVVDTIFDAWEKLVESPTQELYAANLVEFEDVCKDYPKFLHYVKTTILNPFKEKLVRAWTDLVLHLGCRTTNRVEGAHGVVKQYLSTSKGDLGTCWKKIHEMLLNQIGEIHSSFGRSVTVLEHRYKDVTLYSGLGGHISRQAMNFIFVEEDRARKTLCIEKKTCGCVQRTSYGLPCACFIAMKMRHNKPLRLDEIDPHWHKLHMGEEESNEDMFSVAEEWRGIQERLKRVPFQMKLEIKEAMRLLAFPETTMLSPPPRKVATKGAPKKIKTTQKSTRRIPSTWETIDSQHPESQSSPRKKSSQPKNKGARIGISPVPLPKPPMVSTTYDPSNPMYYMPKFMRPYIEGIIDVIGDGHCGFRAIAECVGLTQESHVMVRRALIQELKDHRNEYIKVYASFDRYKYILDGLHPPKNPSSFAPPDKWLTLPDMGHIVASYYNRPVVEVTSLDIGVSETFFPLRGAPPVNPKSNMICLGLIPSHFVVLSLKDDCPLPPSSTEWRNHRSDEAKTWEYEFLDQHDRFRTLMEIEYKERPVPPKKPTNQGNPITFDDSPVKANEDDLISLGEI